MMACRRKEKNDRNAASVILDRNGKIAFDKNRELSQASFVGFQRRKPAAAALPDDP